MTKTKITKKRVYREFKDYVLEKLQDHKFARAYLNEAFAAGDQQAFLLALKNVLAVHGGDMTTIAEEAQLSRQNLYRILSKEGNPKLTSIRSMLHVAGFELAVQPYKGGK